MVNTCRYDKPAKLKTEGLAFQYFFYLSCLLFLKGSISAGLLFQFDSSLFGCQRGTCNKDCALFGTSLRTSKWPLVFSAKVWNAFVEWFTFTFQYKRQFLFLLLNVISNNVLYFTTVLSDDCLLVVIIWMWKWCFRAISGRYWWIFMFFEYVSGKIKQSESPCSTELVLNVSKIFRNCIWDSCCVFMICSLMTSYLLVLYCNKLGISSVVHASAHLAL